MTQGAIRDGFEGLRADREHAAARRRGEMPLGGRLAGRHQRHARDDRVQQPDERDRLLQDHRRPRADADARDPGRARGAHHALSSRAITGKCTRASAPRRASTPAAGSTRSSRRTTTPSARPSACGRQPPPRPSSRRAHGKPGTVEEETKPTTQLSPLLFDLTSLQREANGRFGFSARTHALARAGALRAAQGADLSAHRLARAAGGLPPHGQEDAGHAHRRPKPYAPFAKNVLKNGWVKPNKRIFDNTKISRPLRDHPDAAGAQAPERGRAEALRPGGAPLPRRVPSRRRVPADDAHHHGRRSISSRPKARSCRTRAGSRSTASRAGRERRTCRRSRANEKVDVVEVTAHGEPDQAAGALHRRRRCSPPWKAPASWSRTTSCARRWKRRASARRPRARRSSRA